jgi:hypothetical protein
MMSRSEWRYVMKERSRQRRVKRVLLEMLREGGAIHEDSYRETRRECAGIPRLGGKGW